jgi:hypothetical protein
MLVSMFLARWLPGMKLDTLVETFDQLFNLSDLSPSSFSQVPPRPTGYARAVSISE